MSHEGTTSTSGAGEHTTASEHYGILHRSKWKKKGKLPWHRSVQ